MYKAWVLASGERTWATNGLEFATVDEAQAYAKDLFSRWFGADNIAVLPTDVAEKGFISTDVVRQSAEFIIRSLD